MPSNSVHEDNIEENGDSSDDEDFDPPIVYAGSLELIKNEPVLDIDFEAAEVRDVQTSNNNLWVNAEEVTASNLIL